MQLLVVAVLAGAAPQAATAAPAPVAVQASAPARGKKPGLICVDEAQIGSRLGGHRVCRTAEEWRRDQQEVKDDTDRAQRLAKLPGQ